MPSLLILLFMAFLQSESATASEPRFEDHAVDSKLETCAPLDFMSTSLSRNHQDRILSRKPEVKKPNFAGKYLLLNLSLMMEDLWLIADCSTGKFLKPTLDGALRFRPDSRLIELRTKEGIEWQVWQNGGWLRIGTPDPRLPPSPTPSTQGAGATVPCLSPDYPSYFKADAVRDNLKDLNPEPGQVNYARHYRVLKNELLFDTRWFLMDCRTGKFEREVLSASRAEFRADSEQLTLQDDGKFPRLLKWVRGQWVELPDPGRPEHSVRNVLEGAEARRLFSMLPNPVHHDRLEFEDLICEKKGGPPAVACRIRMVSTDSGSDPHTFQSEDHSWIAGLVGDFGSPVLSPRSDTQILGIQSGFCMKEKSRCEFEARTVKVKP